MVFISSDQLYAVKIEQKEGVIHLQLPSFWGVVTLEAAKEISLQLNAALMSTEGVFST